MPHYDTNVYTNDAWGIRDVVGSGWLGSSFFSAEHSRQRRPEDRLFPPDPADSRLSTVDPHLTEDVGELQFATAQYQQQRRLFNRLTPFQGRPSAWSQTYDLLWAGGHDVCVDRQAYLTQHGGDAELP
jgi:hypothetical protein